MGESIRSLTVKLGYDVDTTGADIFNTRFKSLSDSLETIAKGVKRSLKPSRMIKIGPLEKRVRLLGKRFRRAMRKALRLKPSEFEKLKNDLEFISKLTKKALDKAKKVALVGAAGIAAAIAAGIKTFTGFATVEQARGALEFRAGDNFEEISKKIEKVRKETGNLVSELDALNALNIGVDLAGDLDFLVDNFDTVIKLSKVLGKDIGEVQQTFAQFIATGSNIEEFVKFGEEFFSVEQIEALRKASTDFTAQGIQTRKLLLAGKIEEAKPRLEVGFQKFLGRSQATIDRLSTATEDTVKIVGERLNPILNEAATSLTNSINNYRERLKESGSFVDAWTSSFSSESAKSIIKFFGGVTSDDRTATTPVSKINNAGNITNTNNKNSVTEGKTETTNQVTINVSGTGDPESVAKKVMAKQNEAVIQSNARKNTAQSRDRMITAVEAQ